MNKSEQIPFYVEINKIIELLAKQIYQSPFALLRENCQNAYDAILLREHVGESFEPMIDITLTSTEVRIADNGIGMSRDDLVKHYWRAGSSGKNNPEAKAAGVLGTFGIGAMANFGVANELTVVTEPIGPSQRTKCHAFRKTLSATKDCIEMISKPPTGQPGTTIIARIPPDSPIDVSGASDYIRDVVRHLEIPVRVNGKLVSQEGFETSVKKPPAEFQDESKGAMVGPQLSGDVQMVVAKTGEVWLRLDNICYSGTTAPGVVLLRQGVHQIQTYRSRFTLAKTAVKSCYSFGGIVNVSLLEPTAGREALTTSSLQVLQNIITECEEYVSKKLAGTSLSNMNTGFMTWVANHKHFELCGKLEIRMEPDNQSICLEEISRRSKGAPLNYFEGSDKAMIDQYATDEHPLIIVSTSQPRRKCELAYLQSYCEVKRIVDAPTVLHIKPECELTHEESALALRIIAILETDYFVHANVNFGKISHGLPIYVETSERPVKIVLDNEGSTVATILKLFAEDYLAWTGMVKDFVRNVIFPKISDVVPSSTRQGAEAFLRAIRRPREIFEYEKSDLGSFSEIWTDYLSGDISLGEAARQSITFAQTNIQVVESSATSSVTRVLPDVLENERILQQGEVSDTGEEELSALPAIIRIEVESSAKLLTIDDTDTPLKGYRCFLAITDRVRNERGEFFLQPHRTEIVWGGQKALYIFQHHSGEFGVYYELQATEILSDTSGGQAFPTCTIIVKNQIYIPVPDEISEKFLPRGDDKKRFEVRCELLFPDSRVGP